VKTLDILIAIDYILHNPPSFGHRTNNLEMVKSKLSKNQTHLSAKQLLVLCLQYSAHVIHPIGSIGARIHDLFNNSFICTFYQTFTLSSEPSPKFCSIFEEMSTKFERRYLFNYDYKICFTY
jgi:hypothetical protein